MIGTLDNNHQQSLKACYLIASYYGHSSHITRVGFSIAGLLRVLNIGSLNRTPTSSRSRESCLRSPMYQAVLRRGNRRGITTSFFKMAVRRSARLSSGAAYAPFVPAVTEALQSRKRKISPQHKKDVDGFSIPNTPKRKKMAVANQPPSTPTPLEAKAMAVPYISGDMNGMTPFPKKSRIADSRFTNAPLISPMTSIVVATEPSSEASPSKTSGETSTTEHILGKALKHLIEVDSRLKPVIEKHQCHIFSAEGLTEVIDPFRSLASGIISQQVSGAAAKAIKSKFVALFNAETPDALVHNFPTPVQVATIDISTLRTAGLSQRKAEYIKGLAEAFAGGQLSTEMLLKADYEEVLEKLIAIRGLGKWSVEMFACFGLKRMDVFSTGDLGVQRGMAALIGKDVSKLKGKGGKWKYMTEKEMTEMADKFVPYRYVVLVSPA